MKSERDRLQARRDLLAGILSWTAQWNIPGIDEDKAEVVELDRRLAGFVKFENGE
jgi:hypothetical protein